MLSPVNTQEPVYVDKEKLANFCRMIAKHIQEAQNLAEGSISVDSKEGTRYMHVRVNGANRYAVEFGTERIYVHHNEVYVNRDQSYGNLDTVAAYSWGDVYPVKIDMLKRRMNVQALAQLKGKQVRGIHLGTGHGDVLDIGFEDGSSLQVCTTKDIINKAATYDPDNLYIEVDGEPLFTYE